MEVHILVLPVIAPGIPGNVLTVTLSVVGEVLPPQFPAPETVITAGDEAEEEIETVIILVLLPEVIVKPIGKDQLIVEVLISPETEYVALVCP